MPDTVAPKKVQLSICSSAAMNYHSNISLMHMLQYFCRTTPHEIVHAHTHRTFIHMARKKCAQQALDVGADYLIFLDDDMIWPMHALNRLIMVADKYELDVLSGFYVSRKPPGKPLIYMEDGEGGYSAYLIKPEGRNMLMKCDATGLGCCLFRPSVFERVEQPWFEIPDNMTEDTYFFRKVKRAGIEVHVDPGIPCGHVGDWGVIWPHRNDHVPPDLVDRSIYSDELHAQAGNIETHREAPAAASEPKVTIR